ncbi:hypothetical protein D3C73_1158680 [compost metagenome]
MDGAEVPGDFAINTAKRCGQHSALFGSGLKLRQYLCVLEFQAARLKAEHITLGLVQKGCRAGRFLQNLLPDSAVAAELPVNRCDSGGRGGDLR